MPFFFSAGLWPIDAKPLIRSQCSPSPFPDSPQETPPESIFLLLLLLLLRGHAHLVVSCHLWAVYSQVVYDA